MMKKFWCITLLCFLCGFCFTTVKAQEDESLPAQPGGSSENMAWSSDGLLAYPCAYQGSTHVCVERPEPTFENVFRSVSITAYALEEQGKFAWSSDGLLAYTCMYRGSRHVCAERPRPTFENIVRPVSITAYAIENPGEFSWSNDGLLAYTCYYRGAPHICAERPRPTFENIVRPVSITTYDLLIVE